MTLINEASPFQQVPFLLGLARCFASVHIKHSILDLLTLELPTVNKIEVGKLYLAASSSSRVKGVCSVMATARENSKNKNF